MGYLELIIGPMFAGKSTELIRKYNLYMINCGYIQRILIFYMIDRICSLTQLYNIAITRSKYNSAYSWKELLEEIGIVFVDANSGSKLLQNWTAWIASW